MTSKTIRRRKLRNAFNSYKKKVQEIRRFEHIASKVHWFGGVRSHMVQEDCFHAWREFIKRQKQAKTFLLRSIKGIDKLMKNEAFGNWKATLFKYRK